MNKQELNKFIDKISPTGPGGIDKIKKILKELANGSGSDSDSEGGEGGNIQIVELTYDHIPATGTLSASDLAKLDSDNCLLVMKGKYFRKTFSSSGGIDYKEIGLATVLGGVRSIYFTASKPDGEYTIAYEHPVEANTQTQATTALENIKVGNTTYSVPLSPMIVRGTYDDSVEFTPDEGSPTWAEAREHFLSGGSLIIEYPNPYHPTDKVVCTVSTYNYPSLVTTMFEWSDPENSGGSTPK